MAAVLFFVSGNRAGSLPNSPAGCPPSRLERKLTIKAKELKDALQSCNTLKDESANMKKSLEEMQSALEEKEKSLRNAEYERDLLEKEKVLYDTQIKVVEHCSACLSIHMYIRTPVCKRIVRFNLFPSSVLRLLQFAMSLRV